jgi:hypothetical protein
MVDVDWKLLMVRNLSFWFNTPCNPVQCSALLFSSVQLDEDTNASKVSRCRQHFDGDTNASKVNRSRQHFDKDKNVSQGEQDLAAFWAPWWDVNTSV